MSPDQQAIERTVLLLEEQIGELDDQLRKWDGAELDLPRGLTTRSILASGLVGSEVQLNLSA